MLRTVVVSNETDDPREVIVEPYGRQFFIPGQGLMEIVVERDEDRVEINIREQKTIVWLFEAGNVQIFTRVQRDEIQRLARERHQAGKSAE